MTLDEIYLEYVTLMNSDKIDNNQKRKLISMMEEYYFKECDKHIDIDNVEEVNILIDYVASKCRYRILSYLVSEHIETLYVDDKGNENLFIKENIIPIIYNIYDELLEKIKGMKPVDLSNYEVLSKGKVNEKIIDVLEKIDPSLDCLFRFANLLDSSNGEGIVYLDELSLSMQEQILSLKNSNCALDEGRVFTICLTEGKRFLVVDYEKNMSDVTSTIHELGHYLFPKINNDLPLMREFSSIFYELYALNFLVNKKDEQLLIDNNRVSNLMNQKSISLLIRICIKMLLENNDKITQDVFEEKMKEEIDNHKLHISFNVNNKNVDINNNNLHKYLDILCDYIILLLLNFKKSDLSIALFNQYIVGTYLAICAMENKNMDDILAKMLYCSYNMSKMNYYDIFTLVNAPVDKLGIVDVGEKGKNPQKK